MQEDEITSTRVRFPRLQQATQLCSCPHLALDAAEKKFGQASGHNIDSNKMRGTNEKIVRSRFLPPKIPSASF